MIPVIKSKLFRTIFALFMLFFGTAKAQPIPIELMMGHQYGVADMSFSKKFSPTSRFGFFHMNTIQFDYNEDAKNSFILQDQLFVEALKNLRITAGAAYSKGGFDPTTGLQYIFNGKKLMFLIAPRINIDSEPSYDFMNIIQYKIQLNERTNLFARAKFLNVFNAESNIKSYQWFRLGLEKKGMQFGLAFNLDENGPNTSVESNMGVFVRKEIF
jgi:hypothetical protein